MLEIVLKTTERMKKKEFNLGNGKAITFIKNERHGFIVRLEEVAVLFNKEVKELIPHALFGNVEVFRNGIQYITLDGFVYVEQWICSTHYSNPKAGLVERIMKWISYLMRQRKALPSFDADEAIVGDKKLGQWEQSYRTYRGINHIAEYVVDLEQWEREMLLLLIEVDNGELRRKLVAKIKQVI